MRWHRAVRAHPVARYPYKVLVITLGAVVFLIGVAMLVLPGPGLVVMGIGLLILSAELPWAGRVLRWCSRTSKRWWGKVRPSRTYRGRHERDEHRLADSP